MKKGVFILAIITSAIMLTSNASAFCLWGVIGNTCDQEEEFFPVTGEVTNPPTGEVIPINEAETDTTVTEPEMPEETQNPEIPLDLEISDQERENVDIVLEVTEEELVNLNPRAVDPDGDEIEYEFTSPISQNGLWQTNRGDAGKYIVTITASDGESETLQEVLIVVQPANKIPVIECPETVRAEEGDTITLDCNAFDPDGESVIVSYDGWLTTKTRQTTFQDAGEYTTIVTASDGENQASQEVNIIITDKNRAPTIQSLTDIVAVETDVVVLNPEVSDPDGDEVEIEFSEPFDQEGVFRTQDGDSGEYIVTVTANDGELTTTERIQLTVNDKNTPPVMERIPAIVVQETETVRINVEVFDPEGDEVTILYDGWMDGDTKQTTYDDAGTYQVTVTATDGELSTSQEVSITVQNKNRPPVFVIPI